MFPVPKNLAVNPVHITAPDIWLSLNEMPSISASFYRKASFTLYGFDLSVHFGHLTEFEKKFRHTMCAGVQKKLQKLSAVFNLLRNLKITFRFSICYHLVILGKLNLTYNYCVVNSNTFKGKIRFKHS